MWMQQWRRAASSSSPQQGQTFARSLRQLLLQIHPDRLSNYPEQQKINQANLQILNSVLDDAKSSSIASALASLSSSHSTSDLEFYLRPPRETDDTTDNQATDGESSANPRPLPRIATPVAKHTSAASHLPPGKALRSLFADLFAQAGIPSQFDFGTYFGSPVDESTPPPRSSPHSHSHQHQHQHQQHQHSRPRQSFRPNSLLAFLSDDLVATARETHATLKNIERERDIVQASFAFNGVRILYDQDGSEENVGAHKQLSWLMDLKPVVQSVLGLDLPDVDLSNLNNQANRSSPSHGPSLDMDGIPTRPAASPAFDPSLFRPAASSSPSTNDAPTNSNPLVLCLHHGETPEVVVDTLGRIHISTCGSPAEWESAISRHNDPDAPAVVTPLSLAHPDDPASIKAQLGEIGRALHIRHLFSSSAVETHPQFSSLLTSLTQAKAAGHLSLDWLESGKLARLPVQIVDHTPDPYIDSTHNILCIPVSSSAPDVLNALRKFGRKAVRAQAAQDAASSRLNDILVTAKRQLALERLRVSPDLDPSHAVAALQRLSGASHLLGPRLAGLRLTVSDHPNSWIPVIATFNVDHAFDLGV